MIEENLTINKSCRKAKPIFPEEKEFIERHLNIQLPDDCWIAGGGTKFIWYDLYQKKPLLKFRVDPPTLRFDIVTDNRKMFEGKERLTVNETLERERERIEAAYEKDLNRLTEYVKEHIDTFFQISISGGKDSHTIYQMWLEMLERLGKEHIEPPKYEYVFLNTTNETASVYKYIKSIDGIRIVSPKKGWRQWIKDSGYQLPTIMRRACCTRYKERPARSLYPKGFEHIVVLGMRSKESTKRTNYIFEMTYEWQRAQRKAMGKESEAVKGETDICPIIDWETVDIWFLTLLKGWHINQEYKYGISRVGCMFCPYSSTYENALIYEHYPVQSASFNKILREAYDMHGWRLGWTFEEYANHYWKINIPKMYDVLKKKTPENIATYAKERGLSQELAEKYFNRTCGMCGSRVVETDTALFLKIFGRFEGQKDDRQPLCAKCLAEKIGVSREELWKMAKNFKEQGCELFP